MPEQQNSTTVQRSGHTPGPWHYQEGADSYTHIVRGPNNYFVCSFGQHVGDPTESNARLTAAAPDLLSDVRDTVALLTRCLEKIVYIPETDASGHPHGYSVIQIPEWEVRQKIEWLQQTIKKAEGRA